MVSRMFRHDAFALMVPATNAFHVRVEIDQAAGQLFTTLLEVCPAHEEVGSPSPMASAHTSAGVQDFNKAIICSTSPSSLWGGGLGMS